MNDWPDAVSGDLRARRRANFRHMIKPRSIAYIGGRGMADAIDYARELGFTGTIGTVHPSYEEIGGVPCVRSVAELPFVPDTAWIAVSTERSVDIVAELAAIGCPSAVVYAAGFTEMGDTELERRLIEAAGDMAIMGPNCMGMINFLDGIAVTVGDHGVQRPQRGVACVAQSGTIVGNMVMSERSLPVSHMLSMGNQSVLDIADGIDAVTDDPRVSAIMLYIEGLKDAGAFARAAARAFEAGKPIIVLKAGVSEAGRQIALSHTGSLAGTPELYEALFDRLGIISVANFPELLEMAKLLSVGDIPQGNRVMIETCSGTDSGYCADLADRYGVALPQPDDEVKAALRKVLPAIATAMNPLDVTMAQWADREAQATSLITLLQQPADAAALVINYPVGEGLGETYDPAIEAMLDVRKATGLPCFVITNLPEGAPRHMRELLLSNGIVPLQGMEDAFSCLGCAARHVARCRELKAAGGPEQRILGAGELRPGALLDEVASKAALAEHGVSVPRLSLAASAEDAATAAVALGFPVVVKGHGEGLAHKSELGAVAVNLRDEAAVRAAAETILAIPGIGGLLVETMVTDAVAEVIIGIKRDPSLGLALVIGSGGVLTELIKDSVNLILPASDDEIRRAIARLRGHALLTGFRGKPEGDIEALVATARGIAAYAEANADRLMELDVNPVMVRPNGKGAVAVDALIRLGESAG